MKKNIILSFLLTTSAFGQGILLNAGDSYTYQFDSLPFEGFSIYGTPRAFFSLPIFPSDLGPSGSLRFEMFEDTPGGVPIFSRTLTTASSILDTSGTVPNAWADVQGSIRLTMLSGSITVNVFSLQAMVPADASGFNIYGGRVYLVPEPAIASIVGLCVVYLTARRFRRRS